MRAVIPAAMMVFLSLASPAVAGSESAPGRLDGGMDKYLSASWRRAPAIQTEPVDLTDPAVLNALEPAAGTGPEMNWQLCSGEDCRMGTALRCAAMDEAAMLEARSWSDDTEQSEAAESARKIRAIIETCVME